MLKILEKKKEVSQKVIEGLENLLERAKNGEITSMVYAAEINDDDSLANVEHGIFGNPWCSALIGGIETAKHVLIREILR